MFRVFAILLILLTACINFKGSNSKSNSDNIPKILVITSGPERFDTHAFFNMVFSVPNVKIDTISQPYANEMLLSDSIFKYHAILFFDMWQEISDPQKDAFIELTQKGTGLVFLHHALVSYQEWDTFTEIIGGKYYHDRFEYPDNLYSTYKHDVEMEISVVDKDHPVTKNINDFKIIDEAYNNIKIVPEVAPLLTTNHPDCNRIIGWTHQYNASTIVTILPGHGPHIFNHNSFRKLINNALSYTITHEAK